MVRILLQDVLHWHRTQRKAKKKKERESERETSMHGRHILSLLWEIEFSKTDTGRIDCHGNGRRRTNKYMRKEKRRKENFGV
jgi:hypothetical protein